MTLQKALQENYNLLSCFPDKLFFCFFFFRQRKPVVIGLRHGEVTPYGIRAPTWGCHIFVRPWLWRANSTGRERTPLRASNKVIPPRTSALQPAICELSHVTARIPWFALHTQYALDATIHRPLRCEMHWVLTDPVIGVT